MSRPVVDPYALERPFRYATRQTPRLRSRGRHVGAIARALGRPLYPHQAYIADVATELNPPGSHLLFRYQRVIIAEPRQVGKTTLLRPVMLDRCLMRPGTSVFMTAQNGKYASARWADVVDDLEPTPFGEFATIKRGKGSEVCAWPNGSRIAPFPPTRDGLHGETPDLVGIDEGWAFSAEDGLDLMRAVRPAQQTRRARQVWIMSAAGSADSEWWDELVEIGRASVDDPNSDTAYFEHSMSADADPYDPASWEFHPGLYGLITLDDLANEAKPANNTHADFLRGFMNHPTKVRAQTVLDLDALDALAGPQTPPPPSESVFAFDVAIDRTTASIWRAWIDDAGRTQLRVVESREGDGWLTDTLARIANAHGVTLHHYAGGPAAAHADALTRAGVEVETLAGPERGTAWEAFKGAVHSEQLRTDGSPALRAGFEVAVERTDDDGTRLSRRRSLGPIDAPLSALTARWYAERAGSTVQVW